MQIHFTKYQGTGNDFVMLDNRGERPYSGLTQEQIAFLCDRRFGIGADGLILLEEHPSEDFRMVYYNSDGGESTMCGNGGRCLVAFAHEKGMIDNGACTFEAVDGLHQAVWHSDGRVSLQMTRPANWQEISQDENWLDTGSPHYVQFHTENIADLDVAELGARIRHSEAFEAIGGTNANFVNILEDNQLRVRTFERGVEGETLSCGTGVTACAYAYLKRAGGEGLSGEVGISTPGGNLEVKITDLGEEGEEVWLIGPATRVFEGELMLAG